MLPSFKLPTTSTCPPTTSIFPQKVEGGLKWTKNERSGMRDRNKDPPWSIVGFFQGRCGQGLQNSSRMAFEIRLMRAVKLSMDAAGSRSPHYSLPAWIAIKQLCEHSIYLAMEMKTFPWRECSQKILTQPGRWGSIQMTYDFIQNGLLLPTTMVIWIFSKLCKEFIHMILIQVSFEKGVRRPKALKKS